MLREVLSKADEDTYVLSGACAPEAQEKLFKKLLRVTGFPAERFVTGDIWGTDNDGILARLKIRWKRSYTKRSPGRPLPSRGAFLSLGLGDNL